MKFFFGLFGSASVALLILLGYFVYQNVHPQTEVDAWEYSVGSVTFITRDQQLAESFWALRKELEEMKSQLNVCSRRDQ